MTNIKTTQGKIGTGKPSRRAALLLLVASPVAAAPMPKEAAPAEIGAHAVADSSHVSTTLAPPSPAPHPEVRIVLAPPPNDVTAGVTGLQSTCSAWTSSLRQASERSAEGPDPFILSPGIYGDICEFVRDPTAAAWQYRIAGLVIAILTLSMSALFFGIASFLFGMGRSVIAAVVDRWILLRRRV